MPFFALEFKMTMSGLKTLKLEDPSNIQWELKLKCSSCGDVPDRWRYVVANESEPIPGSRGEANYIEKCKGCGHLNTLSILEDCFKPYVEDKNESWQPVMIMDSRGFEPVGFGQASNWIADTNDSSSTFNEISFSSSEDWADYDSQTNEPVSIENFESRFQVVKNPHKK
ncbi:unnamed protein product [Caenorhabditis auriculariae]|uniref:Uncharacterized protein n=1 Tax=Caenorhabditis auriculariae TaxID=2777116 RepID=A0A8S1HEZ0_9PELO|nr:unnamed protein product [Caenorhabditis auriculariae]